ncbi:MAG TPA: HIT domain-containing protein [Candidatus Binataceae bacterium]|nr:HIT domain-containing protein [Candidatus Binataceae bacterium]
MRRPPAAPSGPGATRQARLWAPWRAAYVSGARRSAGCIFCMKGLSAAARKRRLVLHLGPRALVMLNRYPYNNGHLLIAPRRHLASLELLEGPERADLDFLLAQSVRLLRMAMRPVGFNLGANLGRVAGAGVADHFHWHVVPRWEGDTNFMPVLASVRVLSEHLEASFATLDPLFSKLATPIS